MLAVALNLIACWILFTVASPAVSAALFCVYVMAFDIYLACVSGIRDYDARSRARELELLITRQNAETQRILQEEVKRLQQLVIAVSTTILANKLNG